MAFRNDFPRKRYFEMFPFLDKKVMAEYNKVFRTKKNLITIEKTTIEGNEIFTKTLKIPILEKGKVTKVMTILRDITESKLAELELKYRLDFQRSVSSISSRFVSRRNFSDALRFTLRVTYTPKPSRANNSTNKKGSKHRQAK